MRRAPGERAAADGRGAPPIALAGALLGCVAIAGGVLAWESQLGAWLIAAGAGLLFGASALASLLGFRS